MSQPAANRDTQTQQTAITPNMNVRLNFYSLPLKKIINFEKVDLCLNKLYKRACQNLLCLFNKSNQIQAEAMTGMV